VKRSRHIRLVLIGGITASAVTACGPGSRPPPLSAENVYTNNYYVPGVGYYHAPYRAWYSLPYNHFDAQNQRYFYGGQWSNAPCQNFTNISPPPASVAQQAEAQRTDVERSASRTGTTRGGFGRTSYSHSIHS
jgi:hypothetical protein